MDRLLSLFSVYDFLGYVLAGGTLLAGTYWAFAEVPDDPGAAAVFGIIALGYAVGHLVQSVATIWEGSLWNRQGKPSSLRMSALDHNHKLPRSRPSTKEAKPDNLGKHRPYDPPLQELIKTRVERITGTAELDADVMFAIARADLRARQLDGRAELMNTMYGLCRGLATSASLLIPIFIAAGIETGDWTRLGIAIGVMLVAAFLYVLRAVRYGYRFADQVWQDFAAGVEPGSSRPGDS
jgi:hypothetical protein